MASGKDFSEWLATGRGSDVKLVIAYEAAAEAAAEPGGGRDPGSDGGGPSGSDSSAATGAAAGEGAGSPPLKRRRVALKEVAAHSMVLEEASGWARVLLGTPESQEVRSQQHVQPPAGGQTWIRLHS